jgi:hypothetical protein
MAALLDRLEKREIREHLVKNWMTHDAMWVFNCLQAFGIEKTNQINLAAIRGMAAIEAQRAARLIGFEKKKVDTFEELVSLVDGAFSLAKASFMQFDYTIPEKNIIRWSMHKCFAHDGITKMGAIDGYQCGILERVKSWLESLGVSYTMDPVIEGCLMHTHGVCKGEFRTNL